MPLKNLRTRRLAAFWACVRVYICVCAHARACVPVGAEAE